MPSGVSFVAVTQQFNTTTSMGRLTLNVLLSFAQFEREVTGERIRDKIAASKRKGMWMGGVPPLGYDVRERRLIVNETEADTVREIFERYLVLGGARIVDFCSTTVLRARAPFVLLRHRRGGAHADNRGRPRVARGRRRRRHDFDGRGGRWSCRHCCGCRRGLTVDFDEDQIALAAHTGLHGAGQRDAHRERPARRRRCCRARLRRRGWDCPERR